MPVLPRRWAPRCSGAALLGAAGLLYALVLLPGVATAARKAPPFPGPDVPLAGTSATAPAAPAAPSEEAVPEAATVQVVAPDAEIGPGYWQNGPGAAATVVMTVTNTGTTAADIRGTYTLPPGTHRTGVTAADGCTTLVSQGLRCTLGPAAAGTVTLKLAVEGDGWRKAPLTGSVAVTAGGLTDIDSYSLLLPPGPATPGIGTTADDVTLPVLPATRPENVSLVTHLSNTGPTPAVGAVEIVTPAGVHLVTFPPSCVTHRPIAPGRERCEVGAIDPGKELVLAFGLQVTAPARADVPLSGAAYGYLTPTGHDALSVLAIYRLLISATAATPEPTGTTVAAVATTTAAAPERAAAVRPDDIFSRPLDTIAIVGSVVGLVTLAGIIGVLSLRRRLQDDSDLPTAAPPSSGRP